jgi:hypothetical protein
VTHAIRFPTLAHGAGDAPTSLADLCGQLVSGDEDLRLLSLSHAMQHQRSVAASPREVVEQLWREESLSAWSSASSERNGVRGRTLSSFAHFQLNSPTDRRAPAPRAVVDAIAGAAAVASVSASAKPRLTFGRLHPRAPSWSDTSVGLDVARVSGTLVSNSTSIAAPLSRIHGAFSAAFQRKAFIHWYV